MELLDAGAEEQGFVCAANAGFSAVQDRSLPKCLGEGDGETDSGDAGTQQSQQLAQGIAHQQERNQSDGDGGRSQSEGTLSGCHQSK